MSQKNNKSNKRTKTTKTTKKRARGRPPVNEWPEQIPDTPENIARAILNTPPKKNDEWDYMKRHNKTN